mmetsp:Transcript_34902/g.71248  ORF Transcript_34902/g.71248 Transcript_34902/m.71248 type:complete len:103 (+) Transcript_34902:254-562(+)
MVVILVDGREVWSVDTKEVVILSPNVSSLAVSAVREACVANEDAREEAVTDAVNKPGGDESAVVTAEAPAAVSTTEAPSYTCAASIESSVTINDAAGISLKS